jgi:hypothetical protein
MARCSGEQYTRAPVRRQIIWTFGGESALDSLRKSGAWKIGWVAMSLGGSYWSNTSRDQAASHTYMVSGCCVALSRNQCPGMLGLSSMETAVTAAIST